MGRCTKVSNFQPAPISGNVIKHILYPETSGNNFRYMDTLKKTSVLDAIGRQHDKADVEGLVFNLQIHSTNSFLLFISPCLCRTHIIYRYSYMYIVSLLCPTWQRKINQLGSKPERAPSCLWQHSGSPQPRIKPALLSSPTSVPYIHFTLT